MRRLLFVSLLLASACTDNNHAKSILESQEYKDINFTGYAWFSCSKDDFYHTGFTATAPNGSKVSGTVCAGLLFKGSTVRFD